MTHENTDAERKLALDRMGEVCQSFYLAAVATGCHAFIEFAGLMSEFANVCHDAESHGSKTWMSANVHGGEHLPMRPFRLAYLREKLSCIYGPALFHTEDEVPETDPAREAERVLSALTLALYHEPENLPYLMHTVSHVVPDYEDAIPDERRQAWLDVQRARVVDAHTRAATECPHTKTTAEDRDRLGKEGMGGLDAMGKKSMMGLFFHLADRKSKAPASVD